MESQDKPTLAGWSSHSPSEDGLPYQASTSEPLVAEASNAVLQQNLISSHNEAGCILQQAEDVGDNSPLPYITGPWQTVDLEAGAHSQQASGYAVPAGENPGPKQVNPTSSNSTDKDKPLQGGIYSEADALALLNDRFFVGLTEADVGVYRVNGDGSAAFMGEKDFKLLLANVHVRRNETLISAEKFWRTHAHRSQCEIVFNPGETKPLEYNLWRGFAVDPLEGWDKQWRFLRHIYKVICRRDRPKFWYLMRWLAWAVQHPEEAPGTIMVLKSRVQGTGKSTLGVVMCDVFGRHGRRIDDKDQLLGRFNDELETTCFILAEEILWAGDSRTGDKLKSRITSEIIPIEAKFRTRREVKNRMHVMMTTNHDHAVPAGVKDRRFFVLDVSDEHAQDAAWFGPLYRDLADGGKEQFLALLLNLELGDFHPRALVKTEEALDQQRMSGDSVCQWSQACIDADEIIGPIGYSMPPRSGLDCDCSFEELRQSYSWYCQQHKLHPATTSTLGKAVAGMFGSRKRLSAAGSNRPWGYHVPGGDKWQERLDQRLGVGN